MLIPPKYILTPTITRYLQTIEACREVIDSFLLPKEIELNIRRTSILKSSLYSARIEGNPLTLDEVTARPSTDQKKREVYNILKAFSYIQSRGRSRDLSQNTILELHKRVMNGLTESMDLIRFRTEHGAIFNSAGIAIYLPPPPRQISTLIERLVKFINSQKESFVPIRAILAHYTFEKIHPFLDGNGRVGRLLIHTVLEKGEYGMHGLASIEEFLEKRRSEYYRGLEDTERDVTGYVEFMLQALAEAGEEAKRNVLSKKQIEVIDFLLPRRAEILHIIRDHKLINFDQVRRRFMGVNARTLRYDLKKLQDDGLIRKRGTTNGAWYEAI